MADKKFKTRGDALTGTLVMADDPIQNIIERPTRRTTSFVGPRPAPPTTTTIKKDTTVTPKRLPRTATTTTIKKTAPKAPEATIWDPNSGEKKVIKVGDPIPSGFKIWTGGTATGEEARKAITERLPRKVTEDTSQANGDTGDGGDAGGVGEGRKNVPISEQAQILGFNAEQKLLAGPNREDIRTQKLGDAQAIIDAINENYNRTLQRERLAGEGREGRTRALNISGGLAGSELASTDAIKTEEFNAKRIASFEAERDAKVQNVLNEVRNDTDETFEKRREEFLKDKEDKFQAEKDFLAETKKDALDRVADMAGTGVLADEFKKSNRDVYDNLLNRSGLTEIEFDSMWNAKSKTPVKYQYKELKDGTLLRTGDDGTTKEIGNYSPPDEDVAWNIEPQADGSLYWIKKDDQGEIIDFKKFQSDVKKPGVVRPKSKTTLDKEQFAEGKKEMNKQLISVAGDDNFVSPENYNKAKRAWIAEGYSSEDFDNEYEGFRNPTNQNYDVGGAKAETAFKKAETEKKKAEQKKTETEEKRIAEIDKVWGTTLSARKEGGKSREKIEKELRKKYDGVPADAKNWLDRNF